MNKTLERTQKEINQNRRRFLDMIGKAGVSTSLLKASTIVGGVFASRFAEAQGESPKLIMIYHPNGAPDDAWAPGTSVACDPIKDLPGVAMREMTIGKPGNHGNLQICAGAESYNSADANASSFNMQVAKVVGNTTPYSSIELGVDCKGTGDRGMNFLNGNPVGLIDVPATAFSRIFSSAPPAPAPGSGGGAPSGPSVYDRRLRVVDANKAAIDALRNKLGMNERDRLGEHLAALEQLEQRVRLEQERAAMDTGGDTGGGGGGGGSCDAPTLTAGASPLNMYRAQGDIAVAALKCGLTNVVSIQFNETQASWIGADGTADGVADWPADHHQANHANGVRQLPYLVEYMNKGVAHIINRLVAEGLYSNTVVLVVSEMGDGQDHTPGDGPIIVASGSGITTGHRRIGADHYGIFADVTNLMGLTGSVGGMIHNYGMGGHI